MVRLLKNLFRIILLIFIIGLALICYARYIEPHMLQEKYLNVESPVVSDHAENLKIAIFGDTHFDTYYEPDDFTKVLDALEKMKPDIVFFAGDLIDNYDNYMGDVDEISGKLAEIEAPYGKYAIFGNHDYGGGAENEYQAIMEAGGFTVLKNEYFAISELGIAVIGIDDILIGYGDSSIASWGRPDYYNIILSHAPDVIDEVLDYNVDLMISGHTHGRQINLKFFDEYILPPYGKKYIHGMYEFSNNRNSKLYVNPGIGTTKLPVRFLSPPELTCITLINLP
ncbi:MAG: metallophosphoesterase [Eubacteriales bacterium]|nr:metallophosphoesterase [Eubacteriales bacterium]MDD4629037.1 metallophosphoesterase [Eubacteriales bacterium]